MKQLLLLLVLISSGCLWFATSGCGGGSPPEEPNNAAPTSDETSAPAPTDHSLPAPQTDGSPSEDAPRRTYQPIKLGSGASPDTGSQSAGRRGPAQEQAADSVMAALKPLQVLLGTWEGKTRKQFQGFSAIETVEWIWDLQTDPAQPALTFTSDKSEYFRQGRLTYLRESDEFQFTAVDKEGTERVYRGTFSAPVQDVPGDDKKLQRTFKLELTQVSPESERKLAQVVINQLENNRYLVELADRQGGGFRRADTIGNQRQGTSFALSDTDYGEKTCIISQGLGTISVSHDGKTYWVCCTGCKAAFEADPERWIAKLAK